MGNYGCLREWQAVILSRKIQGTFRHFSVRYVAIAQIVEFFFFCFNVLALGLPAYSMFKENL